MNDKPKLIKKKPVNDFDRQRDNDRSVEVNYMLVLMRKYPDKAKEAAKKLTLQTI